MRSYEALPALFLVFFSGCACSGTAEENRPPATGPDGSVVGATCSAGSACPSGSYCSAAMRCIQDGFCGLDADCSGGQVCGAGSRRCLPAGRCEAPDDCAGGMTCEMGTCVIGGECGSSEFVLTALPPNAVILLDRSGSMDNTIGGMTRWDIAKTAVEAVTTRFDTRIRFGLATYSACEPGGCSAGTIVVPVADTNAMAINGFLRPLRGVSSRRGAPPDYLCGSGDPETSTGRSLFGLVGEPSLSDLLRQNLVLLVTDGRESGSCTGGGQDGPAGAAALLAQDPPVETYVIGFSSDVSGGELDRVATAGGTGRYYPAEDGTMLEAAFDAIASSVVSCDFRLATAPPDTMMLFVYFDDDPAGIPPSSGDGWTYDPATMILRFHGTACDAIRSGSVADIDVVYGCEGPVLE